jgi:uncharacterized protein
MQINQKVIAAKPTGEKAISISCFFSYIIYANRKLMLRKHAISWFEIPTKDLKRAQDFYENILDITFTPLDLDNFQMRMFPIEDPTCVGGALCYSKSSHVPSATDGPLVYLNANPDVQLALDKVEKAGGKIVVPKTQISAEYGYMAMIIDTEGNRIALHSTP